MGAVLAKFRKEKSPAEVLEKIETDITTIEKFSLSTQQRQKRLIGNFLVISIGLYAIGFLIFYFVFFPPTWPERITYSVPLLIFPLLIFLLRRLLAWHFQRKINKNSTKLVTLRAEKKKILEEVMEKETYNVASKLLSKYGDKSYALKPLTVTAPAGTPQVRKPAHESRIQNLNTSFVSQVPAIVGGQQPFGQMNFNRSLAPVNNSQPAISPRSPVTTNTGNVLRQRNVPAQYSSMMPLQQKPPRPYPIMNQNSQGGILEKMVDYLMGDGPQNRYALICKECYSHNGLARQEEFDYTTFRCAMCNVLNPSRNAKPVAPKLPTATPTTPSNRITAAGDTSESSESSSDSSDEETVAQTASVIAVPQNATITLGTAELNSSELSENKEGIDEPSEGSDAAKEQPSEPAAEEPSNEDAPKEGNKESEIK